MKLQQLTIHNIASIQDAQINFDTEPLSSSEVFLITGPTGSGKSTILDAICLALFAKTPRLESTSMQGNTADGETKVNIQDPRQLMRRNTGEAFVTLTFVGNNGISYESTWSLARARTKSTGRLQSKKWVLIKTDTQEQFDRESDIRAEMENAIGLDFNQFCRTTLLAQGEFTRFLNSKDADKAEILEKITGVDIYSKVGQKIFEGTKMRQTQWDTAKQKVASVHVMTEEENNACQAKINELNDEYTKLIASRNATIIKQTWITEEINLAQRIIVATNELVKATSETETEAFKKDERRVQQWHLSADARRWLREEQSAHETIQNQIQALSTLRRDYQKLKGGACWLNEARQKKENEWEEINSQLEAQQHKVPVLENAQGLDSLLTSIIEGRKKIKEIQNQLTSAEALLNGELSEQQKATEATLTEAGNRCTQQEKQYQELEELLKKAQLPYWRRQKEQHQQMAANVTTAQDHIATLEKEKKRIQESQTSLQNMDTSIKDLQKQVYELTPKIETAKTCRDECKRTYDKQRESIDKWAKSMRTKLKIGDLCPVCQQPILEVFTHEDQIDQLVSIAESAWQEAEKQLSDLTDQLNKLNADISAQKKLYEKEKMALENDNTLDSLRRETWDACKKCGIQNADTPILDQLQHVGQVADCGSKAAEQKIRNAEAIEQQVVECRNQAIQFQKDKDQAHEAEIKAIQKYNEQNNKIKTDTKLCHEKQEEVDSAEKKVGTIVDPQHWEYNWKEATSDFKTELSCASRQYQALLQAKQVLNDELNKLNTIHKSVSDSETILLDQMPEWKSIPDEIGTEQPNLLVNINEISAKVRSAQDQRQSGEKAELAARDKLCQYLLEHPENSRETLTALDNIKAEEISLLQKQITICQEAVTAQKATLFELEKQQKEHAVHKPDLEAKDTLDNLKTIANELEQQMKDIQMQNGAEQLKLKQDSKNKRDQSNLLIDAERKETEFRKWERLNTLIGDATGSRFRQIAQSYVLSNLIHNANHYLKRLYGRYSLYVQPGTFVISIMDAYQGGVRRAASTISGGESFLVSLALALALSAFGKKLPVDTLFIDEGFGTLSGEPLQKAVDTLRSLHQINGRHVGIISHVDELRESIPVQIQVEQQGQCSSSSLKVVLNGQ